MVTPGAFKHHDDELIEVLTQRVEALELIIENLSSSIERLQALSTKHQRQDIADAAAELGTALQDVKGFLYVAVTKDVIIIYATRKTLKEAPAEWHGYPVEVKKTTAPRPA
jgi:hypothetical protein